MADLTERDEPETEQKRRFPDPVNLVAGLLTLWVAVYALSDGRLGFTGLDPRWVIAGIALLVGVLLLGASLRPGRRRQR